MPEAILARQLVKSFGQLHAVQGLDFDVHSGECFGLLGPNGAGKTTTMGLVRCVSPLDAGQLKVLGMDTVQHARRIRARLGVVPQNDNLDRDLSVLNNLLLYAGYFGLSRRSARARANELLRFMSLGDRIHERIENLSGGMRRRLLIARALINNPEMLILDEPTTGLDPQSRLHIWQRLRLLKQAGTTMLLSTHAMDEAQELCDRLAIIDRGRVIAEGPPHELIARHAGGEVMLLEGLREESLGDLELESLADHLRLERHENWLYAFCPAGKTIPGELLDLAHSKKLHVQVRKASLEDVFLNLTGRELRE